jgi:hypothetical protein
VKKQATKVEKQRTNSILASPKNKVFLYAFLNRVWIIGGINFKSMHNYVNFSNLKIAVQYLRNCAENLSCLLSEVDSRLPPCTKVTYSDTEKEVQITPLTIELGTVNPPRFEMGHLTPLTMQYRSVDPLQMIRAVLLCVLMWMAVLPARRTTHASVQADALIGAGSSHAGMVICRDRTGRLDDHGTALEAARTFSLT